MKQLVNLFRSASRKNRVSTPHRKPMQRRLQSEVLERRELLAGDILAGHNYAIAEDVNRDFKVTPLDALLVINHLSRNGGSQDLSGVQRGELEKYVDVSADNLVTPLDALRVINRMSRGEAVGELVELRLTPRTADDMAFGSEFDPATRTLTVGVNEIFNLEVDYNDLRNRFGGDFGAFAIYTNIVTNLPDVVQPVLTETQFLAISGNIREARAGNLLFSLAGAPGTTVPVDINTFAANPIEGIRTALGGLGFDPNELAITEIPNEGTATDPLEYQIRFLDLDLDGVDLPALVVTSNLTNQDGQPVVVTSENDSIEPRTPGGAINQQAIGYNLNVLSRTFGDNQPFFGFGASSVGSFDPDTGFVGVGASGPIALGGVPALGEGPLIEPFDSFSIPIRVTQEVDNLQLTLAPTGDPGTQILLYESDDPVPDNMVLINLDNLADVATDGFGLLNIVTTAVTTTVVAGDSQLTTTEDVNATVDLAALTTVTGSTATPTFTITTQPTSGTVTISGGVATFDPADDVFTEAGSPLTFVYTASASGASDTGTITVSITAVNDPPVFVADPAVGATRGVATTITGSTLTGNDLPGPGGETGTVTISAVTAASAQGGTVVLNGQNIVYTSAAGFTGADTITYTISDGSLTSTATLAVNVTAPTGVTITANDGTLAVTEDINATLDLATLVTVAGSTTVPTFTITTQPARGTATVAGTTLTYDPADNDFTTTPLTLVYTAAIGSDSDTGTITINIAPVNDPPVFVADGAVSAVRGVATTITGTTLTTNDLPGPANETGTVTISAVTAASAQGGTVTLSGGNIVYTSPASTTITTDTITYTISDGTSTATATLAVNITPAAGVTVVANNSTLAVTEDVNATINLSTLTTVTGSTTAPTFTITTQPARGTATISGSTLTYDPADDDFTTTPLTLVYTATVGTASDTGTITINIAAVNDPPVFVADSAVSAIRGVATTIAGSTLTTNDRPGPANETGTVTIAGVTAASAQGGTVTLSGQNIVYTSAAGFTGSDTITYRISDGTNSNVTATLTVNVTAPGAVSVVAADSTLNLAEDAAAQTLNLTTLTTVSGSTTAPTFAIVTQPARGTLTLSGSTVTYTPAPNDFTTTPLTFVYRATVGTASDTGTVSINISAVNDPPTVATDAVFARPNMSTTIAASTLTANDRPGPANETGSLTVTAVSALTGTNATRGTVTLVNGNVVYTPPAGYEGPDRFGYTVSDGSLTATGVVNVTVANFVPSSISGSIFVDFVESLANPVRDGDQTGEEPSLGGMSVRLTSPAANNVLGVDVNTTRMTDANGNYSFGNLAPGTYKVTFVAPDTVVPGEVISGSAPTSNVTATSFDITINQPGGLNAVGNDFTVFGMTGAARDTLEILVSQYENSHGDSADFGTALVVLGASGDQQFFDLGEGYEGVRFAEVAVNEAQDAALLTVLLEDGTVASSLLSGDEFAISRNGRVVRLLGSADSFTAVTADAALLASEFGDFRDAIDAILESESV